MKINSIHSNVFFQKRAVAKANVLNGSKPISCTIYQLEEDKDWRYFNKQGAAWKDAEYVDLIADYLKMVHCKKDFSYSGVYVIENQYGECLGYCEYGENKDKNTLYLLETHPKHQNQNVKRKLKYIGETLLAFLAKMSVAKDGDFEVYYVAKDARDFYAKCGFLGLTDSKIIVKDKNILQKLINQNTRHTKKEIELIG